MRPLRFRAWNAGKFEHFDLHNITVPDRALMSGEHPVQQYTGLNDKNGVEIYEGDIVRYVVRSAKDEFTITAKVKWKDFGFKLLEDSGASMPIVSGWTYEIIGNIFEDNVCNYTINLSDCGRWQHEIARNFYNSLKAITNNNKTEILYGPYNIVKALEELPGFAFTKSTEKILKGYHKVGDIRESDFIKFEVFHADDHDDPSNTLSLVTYNQQILTIQIVKKCIGE